MLHTLRHLFGRSHRFSDTAAFRDWADSRGFVLRRVRDGEGCVLEGRLAGQACRVEWGPSQRSYIPGWELRVVAEVDLPRDLVLLVLNRTLLEDMEKLVYEQFVGDVQTRIDTSVPAEMRWLVMCRRATPAEMGRLRERYGAATNLSAWLLRWLATPLNDALAATIDSVPASQPVVLTIKSGRLLLRTAMDHPDAAALVQWASVFEHALHEGVRLGNAWRESIGGGPQTQPCAWPLGEHSQPGTDAVSAAEPASGGGRGRA